MGSREWPKSFLEPGFLFGLGLSLLVLFGILMIRCFHFCFQWFGFLLLFFFSIYYEIFFDNSMISFCKFQFEELCWKIVYFLIYRLFDSLILLLWVDEFKRLFLYLQFKLCFRMNQATKKKNNLLILCLLMVRNLFQLMEELICLRSNLNYQIFWFKSLKVFYLLNYEECIIIDSIIFIHRYIIKTLILIFYYYQFHKLD